MNLQLCPICGSYIEQDTCKNCGTDLEVFQRLIQIKYNLYNRTLQLMKNKKYLSAIDLLQRGLSLDCYELEFLLLAGLSHYALGNLKEAQFYWQEASTPLAEKYQKELCREMGGYRKAVDAYNQALNLMNQKKYSPAVNQLEVGLRYYPKFLKGLELLALGYYACGKTLRCKRVIQEIIKVTNDSLIPGRLFPQLSTLASNRWVATSVMLAALSAGVAGYGFLVSKPKEAPVSVQEVPLEQPRLEPDRGILLATAKTLSERGNYQASADIYLALAKKTDSQEINKEKQFIYSKAAAHYYFKGMSHLKKGTYLNATQDFAKSMQYPVDSYVTDDVLFFKAVAHENLQQFTEAVNLYKKLLQYHRSGDYVQEALRRWGKFANEQKEYRSDYLQLLDEYPEHRALIHTIIAGWEE